MLVYGEKNLNQEFSFAEATKVRALLVDLVETTLAPSVIGELLTLLAAEQAAGGSAT